MIRLVLKAGIALSMAGMFYGCGDDGGGGAISTGLPPGKALSELTEQEARDACNSFANGIDSSLSAERVNRFSCTLVAVPLSVELEGDMPRFNVNTCEELTQMCLDGETVGDEPAVEIDFDSSDIDCESAMIEEDLVDCTATVAEFEACINAMLDELNNAIGAVSCPAFEDLEAAEMMEGPNLDAIPECMTLNEKCPGIDIGGSSESEVITEQGTQG